MKLRVWCSFPLMLAVAVAVPAQVQVVNPPPWWMVSDNNTVSVAWEFATGPTVGTAVAPTQQVAPPWFQGAPWQFTGNLQWIPSLSTRSGVIALSASGVGRLAAAVDNDPRIDWVKVFWMQSEYQRSSSVGVTSRLIEPNNTKLRNIEERVEQLASGWERLTLSAEIFPQPDTEVYEFSFNNLAGATQAVDMTYGTTRCVPKETMEGGEALGMPTGFQVDVETLTGNSRCVGVCFTSFGGRSRYWVSAAGQSPGSPHQLYEIDVNGSLIASHNQPTTVGNPSLVGMRDLAVGAAGRLIYGGMDNAPGQPLVFVFDVQTRQFLPGSTITLQSPVGVTPRALAFQPDGNLGQGTLWTSDHGGAVHEFALNGQLLRTVSSSGATQIRAAAYDPIWGRLYWFARAGSADPRNIRVVGTEFDLATLSPTGVGFYGDLNVGGVASPGGVAGGLELYRRPTGEVRLLCLSQAGPGGRDTIYELAGVFDYGHSCAGGIGMNGIPYQQNGNWQVTLRGVPRATVASLNLGFSKTMFGGVPLPIELDAYGLPRCAVLASLDVSAGVAVVSGGSAAITIPLPLSPALYYSRAYWQWITLDPSAPGSMVLSRGGQTVIY